MVAEIEKGSATLDRETAKRVQHSFSPVEQKRLRELSEVVEREGEINGQKIKFIGVHHIPETLLFERDRLEEAIRSAGAVVLEGAPEIAGSYSDEFLEEIRTALKATGKNEKETEVWIKKKIFTNPFSVFFHEMEQLAKKHGKHVITGDPYSGAENKKALVRGWVKGEKILYERMGMMHMGLFSAFALALIGGTTDLAGAENLRSAERVARWDRESAGSSDDQVPSQKELELKNLGRRKFLRGIAALGTAAAVGPTAFLSPGFGADVTKHPIPATLTYNAVDYRNVVVARGLDALTKREQFDGPVVIIYGGFHTDPLMNYLSSPKLRDAKYELYAPARAGNPPRIGEYIYTEQGRDAHGKAIFGWEPKNVADI